ncbi:DUF4340 domain-containing protein [Candidatus Fermentibacteria bacterium]|nr:DUF4340 domain-containing protein [Candidatus Fermentibacteria bacterium]
MKSKEFTVLIATLAVLVILLLLFANPFKQPGAHTTKGAPLFPALLAKEPARIEVDGANDVAVWKHDDEWLVAGDTEEEVFPADTAGVYRAIRAAQAALTKDLVSDNPEKQALFEVDSSGAMVRILASDSTVLADFVIGKSGSDYATNYVRPQGRNGVYLVGDRIKSQFDRAGRGLRDMFLFKMPKEDIARIDLTHADTLISLQAGENGNWEMVAPRQGMVKKDLAVRIVNTLANFRADDVVGRESNDKGFESPFIRVGVVVRDGTDHTILVGDTTAVEGRRFARVEGRAWVYEIGAYRIETLTKPVDEMLEPPPDPSDSLAVSEPASFPMTLPD